MIFCKTPLRMSYVGGGSDISAFYKDEVGAVVSTSIKKYVYIAVCKKFDGRIRVSYSKTEEVDSSFMVEHPLIREALGVVGVEKGVEIVSMAEIPSKGSGLGSSSSYTVGLLNALFAYKRQVADKEMLARLACEIEINRRGEPIGKQDQYAAAYGGLNFITFHPDESVLVEPICCKPQVIQRLEESTLLFFTGRTRSASKVLAEQSEMLERSDKKIVMRRMVKLAFELRRELEAGSLDGFGEILNENWMLKKQMASGISDPQIDQWYDSGMAAGAFGGKLLGAGNGGFLMFYAPIERHEAIKVALSELQYVDVGFDQEGSQIIYC